MLQASVVREKKCGYCRMIKLICHIYNWSLLLKWHKHHQCLGTVYAYCGDGQRFSRNLILFMFCLILFVDT